MTKEPSVPDFPGHTKRIQDRMERARKAHRATVVRGMARTMMIDNERMVPSQDIPRAAEAFVKRAAMFYDAIEAAEVPDAE